MKSESEAIIELGKSAKRTTLLSLLGILIIILSLAYATYNLRKLEKQVENKKAEIKALDDRVKNLTSTQEDILDFLTSVTSVENIRLMDWSVDWDKTKAQLINLPAGKRKQAIFRAILLAWKEIPFKLNQESVNLGFDSPRFVRYVLSEVGIEIVSKPNVPLSVTMMQQFKQVENPLPGDLMFYRGHIGNFVFIYLSEGSALGHGVGIGMVETKHPLIIVDTSNVNPVFPFIGYFRVIYPDEQ